MHPLFQMMLSNNSVTNEDATLGDVDPLKSQYDMKPGDHAILAISSAAAHSDLVAIELLEPEEYAETFPDWEYRYKENSKVLCRYWSSDEKGAEHIGWFSRIRLIEINDEQFAEMMGWVETGKFPPVPDWVRNRYKEYTEELANTNTRKFPFPVKCGMCGSTDTQIHGSVTVEFTSTAGVFEEGPRKGFHVGLSGFNRDQNVEVHIHCIACDAQADLGPGEFDINQLIMDM